MNHSIRMLHLEDDPRDAELIRQKLKAEGLCCDIVWVNGKEAFESVLDREAFDLVLSDYNLPDYDGMSALRHVRDKRPELPVIVISGTVGEEEAVECLKAGATDYVLKERPQRLGAAVRAALDRKRLAREVREAEKGLRESEERFRQLAENIRDVFFLTSAESTQILYVSPAYEAIWGRTCESLYAQPQSWIDAIHPEDREHALRNFQEGTKSGRFDYQYRIVRPEGEMRWIRTRGYPIKDPSGTLVRIAGIAVDISERKRDEEALRESEYRLDLALEASELAVWEWNLATKDVRFSRHWWPILGYKPDEIPSRIEAWENLTHPIDLVRVKSMLAACVKGSVPVLDVEYRMRAKNGEWRWIRSVGQVVERDAAGRVLRMTGTHGDITERKLAEEKLRRLNRVYAVLSGINTLIVRVRDRQELFQEACRIAVEDGQFPFAWIGALDPATQDVTPVAWAGESAEELTGTKRSARDEAPRGQGAVGRAIRERRPVFNNDITAHGFGGPRLKEILRLGFRSQITLPLFEDQAVVGTLTMYAKEPNFFDEEELRLLTELAGDISFALDNISRQQKLDKLARIRAVSSEINAAIIRIHDREALLRETCRIAVEHGKFGMVWIASLDTEKQEVRPVAWAGFSPEAAHGVSWASISSARGTLGEAIQTRKVAVRNDLGAELTSGNLRQEALKAGCRSTVCLPLVVDDNVVALIVLSAVERGFFDEEELALLNEVAADVSFALQAIGKQEKLEYLSYYDVLTGLPNRHLFVDRLSQQMRSRSGEPQMVVLILFDLERFRNINESLGHRGGDELLRAIAQRLEHAFHGKDYLARISSNGFGAIVRGMKDAADIVHVVENEVFACFRQPFTVSDKELRVSVKAGIAMFPADGEDADTLFKNAESALQRAKASSDRYLFYAADMNAQAVHVMALETRLRNAVDAEQFVLYYQPKIELATGRICGLEALIRWNDPESGLVPPGRFIPLLEETGLILEVGRWALAQALADFRDWTARGCTAPRVAVNVSAIQLQQKNFTDIVTGVVQQAGGLSQALELEITESLIMQDIEASIDKLALLRKSGIHIAMDDFGTGYSSLSYLARLPINTVKIDRSFVSGMAAGADAMSIVSTIIALTHSLELRVVAEGVETEEQARMLRLLRCDEAQGYLFSKPLPAVEIEPLLRAPTSGMHQRGTKGEGKVQ